MRATKLSALLLVGVMGLAACSSSSSDGSASSTTGGGASSDITIAVITHGDGGSFWSVAKKGAEDAGKAMGVTVDYQESNNDPQKQAQLIEAAVTAGVQGIAVSAPNPDAIKDALAQATAAGIPIVTLNSGSTVYKELGAITHVGQDEEIAGEGAGEQLKEAGATKLLCVIHEQNNVGLQSRCDGAAKTFGDRRGLPGDRHGRPDEDGQRDRCEAPGRPVDRRRPGAQPRHRDGCGRGRSTTAGSSAKLATFDLSGDVVKAIEER